MRSINLKTWPRREHFRVFNGLDYPHFNLCANVDLTAFYPVVKERGISFTVALVYLLARAANAIPEFRCRIRGEEVVEHEITHPSITILTNEDLFSFCKIEYTEDFSLFAKRTAEQRAYLQELATLADYPERDDLLYMTGIPWVSFTSFVHPIHLHPVDSVPRFAWGKFFEEGKLLKMPLSVQVHHALMDGIHVGRFYTKMQDYLQEPEALLGKD